MTDPHTRGSPSAGEKQGSGLAEKIFSVETQGSWSQPWSYSLDGRSVNRVMCLKKSASGLYIDRQML